LKNEPEPRSLAVAVLGIIVRKTKTIIHLIKRHSFIQSSQSTVYAVTSEELKAVAGKYWQVL
jgi:hypothetical protein